MKFLIAIILLLFASPVCAAELHVDSAVCQQLVKHVPDADVAYQPGVSADGRIVAPADMNASPLNHTLEHQVVIPLYNNAIKTFGLSAPTVTQPPTTPGGAPKTIPLVKADTVIGYVTLSNGQAYLNGQAMDGAQQDELAVLCIQREKR